MQHSSFGKPAPGFFEAGAYHIIVRPKHAVIVVTMLRRTSQALCAQGSAAPCLSAQGSTAPAMRNGLSHSQQ